MIHSTFIVTGESLTWMLANRFRVPLSGRVSVSIFETGTATRLPARGAMKPAA